MDNAQLLETERAARIAAHNAPIYTGDKVEQAVRSSVRACRMADEWMSLRWEITRRGLTALEIGGVA